MLSLNYLDIGDDTMKLWDIRNFKKCINVAGDLENLFPMTTCAFSPDDQVVATGTSVRKGKVKYLYRAPLYEFCLLTHTICITRGCPYLTLYIHIS